jgi:hypothetical protein
VNVSRIAKSLITVLSALLLVGCAHDSRVRVIETSYVKSAGVSLLDQLGPGSKPVGTVEAGAKVEVLDKRGRWVQVRLPGGGRTGWLHSNYLASEELFDEFQRLSEQSASLPSQGKAVIRRRASLHTDAAAASDSFYVLNEGEEVSVLAHTVADRAAQSPAVPRAGSQEDADRNEPPAQIQVAAHEDWLLVRGGNGRTGWVRESAVDMAPPLDVARYSEGLKIRAWSVLYQEQENGETHPWYVWATIHPRPGLPFDYDEIRVFVWNPGKSRYETSYRERNLIGFYPLKVWMADTPAGRAPAFSVDVEDAAGKRFTKNYVMAGRIVKRQS